MSTWIEKRTEGKTVTTFDASGEGDAYSIGTVEVDGKKRLALLAMSGDKAQVVLLAKGIAGPLASMVLSADGIVKASFNFRTGNMSLELGTLPKRKATRSAR